MSYKTRCLPLHRLVLPIVAAACVLSSVGCGSGSHSSASLTSIQVSPSTAAVRLGGSQQFTATGIFNDGTSQDVTATVTWSSSQPNSVFVNNHNGRNGFATGIASGTSTIAASQGSVQGTGMFTVSNMMPRFAYVSPAQHGPEVGIYTEGINGLLTPVLGSPIQVPGLNDMTIDPTGKFLFTTEQAPNTTVPQVSINSYTVDRARGTFGMPPVSTLCCNYGSYDLVLSTSEQTLQVAGSQNIATLTVDPAAKLSLVGSTPVLVESAPVNLTHIAVEPAGKFLYVGIASSANMAIFSIDSTTGMLAEQGTVPISGQSPDHLVFDPTGQFLYVTHPDRYVLTFLVNGTTGALSSVGTTPTRGSPGAAAVHPTGKWIYIGMCCNGTPSISGFSIDPATGNLLEVTNIATAAGGEPTIVAVEPTGKFLYVEENFGTDVFNIDPLTGALTLLTRQNLLTPIYFTF